MKKTISGFLIGAVLFAGIGAFAVSYIAEPAGFKVLVKGHEFKSAPPPLVVEGRTYLPLRAVGEALGVPVNWNEELSQAEVSAPVEYPVMTLSAGVYVFGEDIAVGKYNMKAVNGNGNFSFYKEGEKYADKSMMFGTDDDYYTLEFKGLRGEMGDRLEINHNVIVEMSKVN